jgi:hypothetical protein
MLALKRLHRWLAGPAASTRCEDQALALFRAGIALSVLGKQVATWPVLDLLYGPFAVLQPSLADALARPGLPTVFSIARALDHAGLSSVPVYQAVYALCLLSALALLLGAVTRLSALVCWITNSALMNSASSFIYGVDDFQHIGLFYCIVFPVARAFSLDALRGGRMPDAWLSVLGVLTLRAHVCLIYLSAGYAKFLGAQWWNGEAIWRAFLQPGLIQFPFTQFDLQTFASFEPLFRIAGLAVVALQLSFPMLVLVKPLRRHVLAAMIALHLGIALCLGLYLFSFTIIVFDLAAFYDFAAPVSRPFRPDARRTVSGRSGKGLQTAVRGAVEFGCAYCAGP